MLAPSVSFRFAKLTNVNWHRNLWFHFSPNGSLQTFADVHLHITRKETNHWIDMRAYISISKYTCMVNNVKNGGVRGLIRNVVHVTHTIEKQIGMT